MNLNQSAVVSVICTSAAKSDLSILPSSFVSSDLSVYVPLVPDVDGPVSDSKGLAPEPELGSKERLAVPAPEGVIACSASAPSACSLTNLRAPPPELGSNARLLADAEDCPKSCVPW